MVEKIMLDKLINNMYELGIFTLEDLLYVLCHSYDDIFIVNNKGEIYFANKNTSTRLGKRSFEFVKEGSVLKENKTRLSKENQDVVLMKHKLKTGADAIITSVPVYKNSNSDKPYCYIANYRQIQELSELQYKLDKQQLESKHYLNELMDHQNKLLARNNLIFRSNKMKDIIELLNKVAHTGVNVLLNGESGVGKGVIAKHIHITSQNNTYPFVQINCGAIPENLIESELFGYEKGAFTGAIKDKPGILETGEKGTVLLDEIGDLPLSSQVKLLQVIQDGIFYRVGGTKKIKLNARLLFATNKDLSLMVRKGLFREDLYYRINVVQICIPPLRERSEDIVIIANHVLDELKKKYGIGKYFTTSYCDALDKYSWPGNVRELENVIERSFIITEGYKITTQSLPQHIRLQVNDQDEERLSLKELIDKYERNIIMHTVEREGSIRKAAKVLGVHHSTIVRKRKHLRF